MKNKWQKILLIIVSIIFSVTLIFFGCGEEEREAYAEFEVSGSVRAADNQEPIPGIYLSLLDSANGVPLITGIYSDSSGWYTASLTAPRWWDTWILHTEDVDSGLNGSFQSRDTMITLLPDSTDTVNILLERALLAR